MKLAARLTKVVLWASSFILSLVLYLYVQIIDPTPTVEVRLQVHARNLAHGLVFDAEGIPVIFSATGPRDVLNRLQNALKDSPSFVIAIADLKKYVLTGDQDERPVIPVVLIVKPPPEFDSITFTQPNPLDGAVFRQKTGEVKIRVTFPNSTPSSPPPDIDPNDFEVIPPRLTITGTSADVKAADPFVTIDPQEVERTGAVVVPINNLPAKLVAIPNVQRVEVRASKHQRPAIVNVNSLGHPASGYRVANYYVLSNSGPATTVWIEGPASLVDKTSTVDATIDISGITKSFTFQPEPHLPSRLHLLDPPLQIHVDIEKIPR